MTAEESVNLPVTSSAAVVDTLVLPPLAPGLWLLVNGDVPDLAIPDDIGDTKRLVVGSDPGGHGVTIGVWSFFL